MRENLTEMVFVLDRSGSMSGLAADTIGGFNELIEKQKKIEGDAYVTTVLFDHEYEVLHDHVALGEVAPLTDKEYFARGSTALLDAVGRTIDSVGARLAATPEEERPAHVVFVITTDGMENASREYTAKQVREMVEHQQQKYSWQFVFLGANMDAVSEARNLGISAKYAADFTPSHSGVRKMYSMALDSVMSGKRTGVSLSADWKSALDTDEK